MSKETDTHQQFIVAEVSKNWKSGDSTEMELLSARFEMVINVNLQRGYELIDWKVTSFVHGDLLTETIIAIFEKVNLSHPKHIAKRMNLL